MKEIAESIFGVGDQLQTGQMIARATVVFLIALILIRVGGIRIFGKKSAFDEIIVIMLGAVLSRAIVGASAFGSTVAASAVMILIHRTIALLCIKSRQAEAILKGKAIVLYTKGKIITENLYKCSLSENDLYESLRLETNQQNFEKIETAYMENNGRVSFIFKY